MQLKAACLRKIFNAISAKSMSTYLNTRRISLSLIMSTHFYAASYGNSSQHIKAQCVFSFKFMFCNCRCTLLLLVLLFCKIALGQFGILISFLCWLAIIPPVQRTTLLVHCYFSIIMIIYFWEFWSWLILPLKDEIWVQDFLPLFVLLQYMNHLP